MNPGNYQNITTATTTTVESGPGIFRRLIIGTTAAGTITIYDNTAASGTKIATLKASIAEGVYVFDCRFSIGLTIVTGAASDCTVTWE
jgi:hypothetical protein